MSEDREPGKGAPKPPTAGEVWALYQARENDGVEGEIRRLAPLFRALTRMTHKIDIPEQYKPTTKEVRTPFVRDAWLRTVAALTRNDWMLHIEPKSPSQNAKKATGLAERWGKAAMNSIVKEVGSDAPLEATKALVRDAESVIKMVHRPDAWANFPRRVDESADEYLGKMAEYKKGSPLPFAMRCVDRLQLIFDDGEWGDTWVVEYGEYAQPYLKSRFGMVDDPERPGRLASPRGRLEGRPSPEGYSQVSTGNSVKLEYFDADWWCCVIDGEMAPEFPKPNPYGPKLPYSRAKADDDPEPILYSTLYLVPSLDAVLTAWTNWMWLGMFPNPLLEDVPNSQALPAGLRPPTGDDGQPADFTWKPGKMLEPPRGKKFSFMQPPPVGADAKEMTLILRSLIEIAGVPTLFRGVDLNGSSGYNTNQIIGQVLMMMERANKALTRQLEKSLEFFFYLIPARIKNTVYVMGQGEGGRGYLGLRPEGQTTEWLAAVDQLGEVTVEREPDTSAMEQALAMIARQLTEGAPDQRLISLRTAREKYLKVEDPEKEQDEIWVEDQMANNAVINQIVVDNALRQADLWVPPKQNPATNLVGPDGVTPLVPPGLPGALTGGLPTVPGLNMPLQPAPPQGGGVPLPGGRPAGMYPGRPGTPVQA